MQHFKVYDVYDKTVLHNEFCKTMNIPNILWNVHKNYLRYIK